MRSLGAARPAPCTRPALTHTSALHLHPNPQTPIKQTHELGHYFGLMHTFGPGACTADGGADGILDTPAQVRHLVG